MPMTLATNEPASAIQDNTHRRVSSANMENPTPKIIASHTKIRDGTRTAS
ncbi:Uncharacterised protein [Mycobacteroides abscessus]|nr:Uncharacterised protein [Mycobacteroides abscessus]